MDKSGTLGGVVEELGQTLKKGGKTAMEQVVGTGAYKSTGTPSQKADLSAMKTKEEEEKAKNLAIVRQRLAQQMTPPQKASEPRPAERVEIKKQEELRSLQQKQAQKPPPLPIAQKQGTREKLPGVSG